MRKTLDDLLADFDAAVLRDQAANREEMTPWACRRAGIIALVMALRDEIDDTYEREGCSWDGAHAYNRLNEILAPREGGSREAGTVTAEPEAIERTTPASPAPVCEWTDVGDKYQSACGRAHFAWTSRGGVVVCPACKKPIDMTEAQR